MINQGVVPIETREFIQRLHSMGKSLREIGVIVNRAWSTVRRVLKKYSDTGLMSPSKKNGRKRVTNERTDRAIVRTILKDRRASAGEAKNQMVENGLPYVCNQTVRNRLAEYGLKSSVATRKPFISKKNKMVRQNYAENYVGMSETWWKKVIFTDESSFEIYGVSGKRRVWKKSGETNASGTVQRSHSSGQKKIMVWAAIGSAGPGSLHFCTRSMTQDSYLDVLETCLPATIEKLGLEDGYALVQDNAPCHKAHRVMRYLRQNIIPLLPHPPQSPDLNPIENLWADLKRKLSRDPPFSEAQLKEKLTKLWNEITPEYCQALVGSMTRRLEAVIKAKGDFTKY
jgi:transposase